MRYREYKKINLPWVAEVPSHWSIVRNKNIFKAQKELVGKKSAKTPLLSLTTRGIKVRRKDEIGGKTPETYDTYQLVKEQDLILCLFDLDVSAVFSDVSKHNGMISPAYDSFEIFNGAPEFYKYIFDKIFQDRSYKVHSKSVRYTITTDNFLRLQMIAPPKEEQEQIAKFLDWKVNEIDRLISNSFKKIEGIKEIWQKKLEDTINIRNSMLNIPLKHLVKSNERSLTGSEELNEIDYIEISDVGYGYLKNMPKKISFKEAPSRARRLVKENDIIISTVRTYLKSIYRITEDEKDSVVSTGFSVLSPNKEIDPDYLYLKLSTQEFLDQVQRNSSGVSYPAISDTKLLSLKVNVERDIEKQRNVTKELLRMKNKVDKAVKLEKQTILHYRELKNSLISEVVTGKIDVRNIEIPTYEKVETNIDEDLEFEDAEIDEEV